MGLQISETYLKYLVSSFSIVIHQCCKCSHRVRHKLFIFFILFQPESEAGQAGAKRHAQEERHHDVTVVTDVTGHRRLQDGAVGQRQRDPGAG